MYKDLIDFIMLGGLWIPFAVFPLGAIPILRLKNLKTKRWVFALYNFFIAYLFFLVGMHPSSYTIVQTAIWVFPLVLIYAGLVGLNYFFLSRSQKVKSPGFLWAAYACPVVELILIKYVTGFDTLFAGGLARLNATHMSAAFLGISYISFRLCFLVQEVSNGVVEMPNLLDYFSFAFFVPTLSVGPISPFAKFSSYLEPNREIRNRKAALLRIAVGLWKYAVLSSVLGPLTYTGLLLDGHPHAPIDFFVSVFAYSIYLYCNFSGLCDMAIGAAGLIGVELMENFDRPFLARNFQEFWTRWHISLSSWMRQMLFTPVVKVLARAWGPRRTNDAIAVTIVILFVLIGIWHGAGINFVLYGLSQGIGVAFIHYTTLYMRKRLGKDGFNAYRSKKIYYWLGCGATYLYFSATLFLFANSIPDMVLIAKGLGLHVG